MCWICLLRLASRDSLGKRFDRFGRGLLLVRRMEVKIYGAERARILVLAQDYCHVFIQSDAMAKDWPTIFIGFDRFIQQGDESGFKFLWYLIDADDVSVVRPHRFHQFRSERFNGHTSSLNNYTSKRKCKKVRTWPDAIARETLIRDQRKRDRSDGWFRMVGSYHRRQ